MDNEIELISDGEGLAVIGESTAVERFVASLGLLGSGVASAQSEGDDDWFRRRASGVDRRGAHGAVGQVDRRIRGKLRDIGLTPTTHRHQPCHGG